MTIDGSQTHNKVVLQEVDKSVDLRMQRDMSEIRRSKSIAKLTEMLTTKDRQNNELQESYKHNMDILRVLVEEATKKIETQGEEIAHCKQQMEEECECHQREQAAREKEMEAH
jgi:hypothetical protein